MDQRMRFLVACRDTDGSDLPGVRSESKAFLEFGLPLKMRTDNGPPFASRALGGLCKLAVWWIQLGILPECIEPGHPEQNGRHERMHRTLKAEATQPPGRNLLVQQRT